MKLELISAVVVYRKATYGQHKVRLGLQRKDQQDRDRFFRARG